MTCQRCPTLSCVSIYTFNNQIYLLYIIYIYIYIGSYWYTPGSTYATSWHKLQGFPRLAASFCGLLIRCKLNDHEMSSRPRSTHDVNQDYLRNHGSFLWVMGTGKWQLHTIPHNIISVSGEVSTDPEIMHLRKQKVTRVRICVYTLKKKQTVKHIPTSLHHHDRENPFVNEDMSDYVMFILPPLSVSLILFRVYFASHHYDTSQVKLQPAWSN